MSAQWPKEPDPIREVQVRKSYHGWWPIAGDWAWTYDGGPRASEAARVFVPDVKHEAANIARFKLRLEPLRGHAYSLAAFNTAEACVGWMDVVDTGHEDVRAWIKATGWKPKQEAGR